ncbi:hypothetical protein B0H14DRAFT_3507915 [Mycena olivaceomarginata]|nr:hypothetical protein B0H14DRAFT_3507915 [Mycena olivaceomarginata]
MPCVAPLSALRLCASVASGPPAKNRARKLHSPTPAAAYDTIYRPNSMRHGSQTAPPVRLTRIHPAPAPFIALHLPAVPLPILPRRSRPVPIPQNACTFLFLLGSPE